MRKFWQISKCTLFIKKFKKKKKKKKNPLNSTKASGEKTRSTLRELIFTRIKFHEFHVILADFTKISSCKNLDYLKRLNQANQSEQLCKHLFLSNTKRYGNRQNVFLANFAKFNSREVFEAGFFIFFSFINFILCWFNK